MTARRTLAPLAALLLLSPRAARAQSGERAPYVNVLGTATIGRSLRFNNPYRLETPLGSTPESVSLGASYLDLSVAALLGRPWGAQHGLWVHGAFALSGIDQGVLSPTYVFLWRFERGHALYGRVGPAFVTGPSTNLGAELAAGGIAMLTGALGVTAEVNGSAFYGAATREVSATLIPLLAAQVGLALSWEALP